MTVSPALGATSPALPAITPQTKSKYEYLCLDLTRAYCREAVSDQSTCLSVIAKVALLAFPLIAILAALEAVFDLVIAAPITFIANCIAGPQEIPAPAAPSAPSSPVNNGQLAPMVEESQISDSEESATASEISDEEPEVQVGQRQTTQTVTTEQPNEESQVQVGQGQTTQTVITEQPNEESEVQVGQGQTAQTVITEQPNEESEVKVGQGQTAPTVNTTNVVTPSDTSGPKVLKAAETKNPTPREVQNSKKGNSKGKSRNLLQAEQRAAQKKAETEEARNRLRANIAASREARKSQK